VPRTTGPFPGIPLESLDGRESRVHAGGAWPTLVLVGHSDCRTTRDTLPLVDRIHRRGRGLVTAVLQDTAAAARDLAATLGLAVPILLEADPYPLAAALDLAAVPTLFELTPEGQIASVSEGLQRADLEAFAARLGVDGPLLGPEDAIPAHKPG
jgi:hypothetical protein